MNGELVSCAPAELAALAAAANRHHEETGRNLGSALDEAIKCGLALLEARALVKHRQWSHWLRDNFAAGPKMAMTYQRLALYRNEVGSAGSLNAARKMLVEHQLTAPQAKKKATKAQLQRQREVSAAAKKRRDVARRIALDAEMSSRGGDLAVIYAAIRKLALLVDAAGPVLRPAAAALVEAEACVVVAIRQERAAL